MCDGRRPAPSRAGRGQIALVAASAMLLGATPIPVAGQRAPTLVGAVGGYTRTTQAWKPPFETQDVGALLLGAFTDVTTPLPWLSARVEAAYTQRGGNVLDDVGGRPVNSGIRTDYVSLSVQLRFALAAGPARVHVSAGVLDELVTRSRLDPGLAQVLDEEGSSVFGAMAGGGVGVWVTPRVYAEVEARTVRLFTDAYTGDFISVRNRSRELVARVAVPLRVG